MPKQNLPTFEELVNSPIGGHTGTGTIGIPLGNTGFGTSKYDRPVNYKDFLYNPEEHRWANQSNWDVIGNSLMHFTGSAINAAAEIPAIMWGAMKMVGNLYGQAYSPELMKDALKDHGTPGNILIDDLSNIFDNEISRHFVDPINNWFQNTFQVYQSQKQKDSNFFSLDNLLSGHFLDVLASGAGYTAGSIVTGAALTKMLGLLKAAKVGAAYSIPEKALADAAKSAKMPTKLNIGDEWVFGGIMSGMEASLEARQTVDQIKQTLKEQHPELSDQRIEDIAHAGGLANFAFNMAILVPSNTAVFGHFVNPGAKSFLNSPKFLLNETGDKFVQNEIKNKFLRGLKKATVNDFTKGLFTEGIFQEGVQYASNQAINESVDKYMNGNLSVLSTITDFGKAYWDALTTKEGLENVVTGALMGGISGGFQMIKGHAAKENKEKLAFLNKNLPEMNTVLKDKIMDANRTMSYTEASTQALKNSDQFEYYTNKYNALVSLVQQHIKAGTLDVLKQRIRDLKSIPEEQINALLGNDYTKAHPESWKSQQTIDSLLSDIDRIQATDERVKRLFPNPYNPNKKEELSSYLAFGQIQGMFTHLSSNIFNTDNRIAKLGAELTNYGLPILSLEQFKNMSKEDKESIQKQVNTRLESLEPTLRAEASQMLKDYEKLLSMREDLSAQYETHIDNIKGLEKVVKEAKKKIDEKVDEKEVKNEVEQSKENNFEEYEKDKTEKLAELRNELDKINNLISNGSNKERKELKKKRREIREEIKNLLPIVNTIKNANKKILEKSFPSKNIKSLPEKEKRQTLEEFFNSQDKRFNKSLIIKTDSELFEELNTAQSNLKESYFGLARLKMFNLSQGIQDVDVDQLREISLIIERNEKRVKAIEDEILKRELENEGKEVVSIPLEEQTESSRYFIKQLELEEAFKNSDMEISEDGYSFVIRGEKYFNLYSDPLQAINRDKDGNISSISLTDKNGKTVHFREERIVDNAAYAILGTEINLRESSETRSSEEIDKTIENLQNLKYSVEVLNRDLLEVLDTIKFVRKQINKEKRIYKRAGFTKEEINTYFEKSELTNQLKELNEIKSEILDRLNNVNTNTISTSSTITNTNIEDKSKITIDEKQETEPTRTQQETSTEITERNSGKINETESGDIIPIPEEELIPEDFEEETLSTLESINEEIVKENQVELDPNYPILLEKINTPGIIRVKRIRNKKWQDAEGNVYEGIWYKERYGTGVKSSDKEFLYGAHHFTRMWWQGRESDNPAIQKAFEALQRIMKRSDWRSFIKFKVSKDFVNANKSLRPEERYKFTEGKKVGIRDRDDIDILMELTDPDTNLPVVDDEENPLVLTAIQNPGVFVTQDEQGNIHQVNFDDLDLTTLNDLFQKRDAKGNLTKFEEEDLTTLKTEWNALKKFNDDLVRLYGDRLETEKEIDLPEGMIRLDANGQLAYLKDEKGKRKMVNLTDPMYGTTFSDSPIFSYTHGVEKVLNGKPFVPGVDPLVEDVEEQISGFSYTSSYFILAKLKNGISRIVRIFPKTIASDTLLEDLRKVKKRLNEVGLTEVEKKAKKKEAFKIDGLEVSIALNPTKSGVINLGFGHRKSTTQGVVNDLVLVVDKVSVKIPDEALKSMDALLSFINNKIKGYGHIVNEKSFRKFVSKEKLSNSDFEVDYDPEIIQNWTLSFGFPKIEKAPKTKSKKETPKKKTKPKEEVGSNTLSEVESTEYQEYQEYPEYLKEKLALIDNSDFTEEEKKEYREAYISDWKKTNKVKDEEGKTKQLLEEKIINDNLSFEELEKRLKDQIPSIIGIKRVDTILKNLQTGVITAARFIRGVVELTPKINKFVVDHEAYHVIHDTVLTEQEQIRYENAKKRELNFSKEQLESEVNSMLRDRPELLEALNEKRITRDYLERLVYQEYLADDYALYRQNKLDKPITWKSILFDLLDKIIKFITGRVDIESLYKKISEGKFTNPNLVRRLGTSGIAKTKLIGGLNSEDSRTSILTVVAKVFNIQNKRKEKAEEGVQFEIDELTIDNDIYQAIKELEKFYSPFDQENTNLSESIKDPIEKKNFRNFLVKFNSVYSNPEYIEEIADSARKYLKFIQYDPIRDIQEVYGEEQEKNSKEYDILTQEKNPLEYVGAEIKQFIATTFITKSVFGKKIDVPVNFERVYNRLLMSLSDKSSNQVLKLLNVFAKHDEEINAVLSKIEKEKNYNRKTRVAEGKNNQAFIIRLIKAFELSKIPQIKIYEKDNKMYVSEVTKLDAGEEIFNTWKNNFEVLVNTPQKFGGNKQFRQGVNKKFTDLKNTFESGKIPSVKKIIDAFNDLEIRLNEKYVKVLFASIDSTDAEEIFSKENMLTKEDIELMATIIRRLLDRGGSIFSNNDLRTRLQQIAEGNALMDDSFFLKNHRAPDGTNRFSYVPSNHYDSSIRESREEYSTEKGINKALKNKYLKNSPFFNQIGEHSNERIKEIFSKLKLVFLGENEMKLLNGKIAKSTYADSSEEQIVRIIDTLFDKEFNQDFEESVEKRYYVLIPSIIADKRSFYGVIAPKEEYYVLNPSKQGEFTKLAEQHLKGVLNQEIDRLKDSPKNPLFLYFPFLNEEVNTELVQKLKKDGVQTHWAEVYQKIKRIIDEEVSALEQIYAKYKIEKTNPNVKNSVYLYNFVLNQFLNSISVSQLTEGGLESLKYKDLGEGWVKNFMAVFADRFKRESRMSASGRNRGDNTEYLVQYTTDTVMYYTSKDGSMITKEDYNKLSDEEKKEYSENTLDDGQSLVSIAGYIKALDSHGTLTEKQIALLKKLNGEVLDKNEHPIPIGFDENRNEISGETRKSLDMISLKDVFSGKDSEGNETYLKTSFFPLDPWSCGYFDHTENRWKPLVGMEVYFYSWYHMNFDPKTGQRRTKPIDIISPKGASKLFFGEALKSEDIKSGELKDTKLYTVLGKDLRQQVIKKSKKDPKIPLINQSQANLDSALSNTEENNKRRERYQLAQEAVRNQWMNILQSQVANSDGKLKQNLEYLLRKMRDTIESTTPDIQRIELLKTINGELEGDLNYSFIGEKPESIFMKYLMNAFRLPQHGVKTTLVAGTMYQVVEEIGTNRIITLAERKENPKEYKNPKKYTTRYLKASYVGSKEGEFTHGERVITEYTAKKLGLKIGDEVWITRVPQQTYGFMGVEKIVDIIPDSEHLGDISIVPPQRNKTAGLDLDDDADFIFVKEKNKKGKYYGEESSDGERWESFVDWYSNPYNFPDIHRELVKEWRKEKKKEDEILSEEEFVKLLFGDPVVERVFRKFNLPGTFTEFKAVGSPKTIGALNNELFDSMVDIFKQPELRQYFLSVASTDQLKKMKKEIEEYTGESKKYYNIFSLPGILKAWNDNTASTKLRGTAVNTATMATFLMKNNIKINPALHFKFEGKSIEEFNQENLLEKLNWLSEKISMVIDNSKEPMAATFYLNPTNIGIYGLMNALDISIESDTLFSVQFAIKNIQKGKNSEEQLKKYTNLYKQLYQEEIPKDEDLTTKELRDSVIGIEKLINVDEESALNTMRKLKSQYKDILRTQVKALRVYDNLSKISSFAFNLSKLGALNRTIGSNLSEAQGFLQAFRELSNKQENEKGEDSRPLLIDPVLKNSKVLETNVDNLSKVIYMGKQLFWIGTRTFGEIRSIISNKVRSKYKQEIIEKVNNEFKSYIFMQVYKKVNPSIDFRKYVYNPGEETIVDKFNRLLNKDEFKHNKLIRALTPLKPFEPGNPNPISILAFDSTSQISAALKEQYIEAFQELQRSEDEEIKKFASEDLVHYLVMKDSLMFKNNSFSRFIPPTTLKKYSNVMKQITKYLFENEGNSEELNKNLKELLGKSEEELIKEFYSLFAGNKANSYLWGTYYDPGLGSRRKNVEWNFRYGESGYIQPYILSLQENKEFAAILNAQEAIKRGKDSQKQTVSEPNTKEAEDFVSPEPPSSQDFDGYSEEDREDMVNDLPPWEEEPTEEELNDAPILDDIKEVKENQKEKLKETKVKPVDNSNSKEYINHSGGAYGADTFWDIIGREFGVINHKHYRDIANQKLSKKLRDKGIKATIVSKEDLAKARQEIKKLLGKDLSDNLQGNLQARNYYQVTNSDGVYAIGILNNSKTGVSGGTNTAIQLGIKLSKPTYVWDINTEKWYKAADNKFVETETPVLTKNFAGVGTRDIESYNVQNKETGDWEPAKGFVGEEKSLKAQQAIRDVYEKTFRKTNTLWEQNKDKIEKQHPDVTEEIFNQMSSEEKDKFIKCLK